jgi:hypothetical protein
MLIETLTPSEIQREVLEDTKPARLFKEEWNVK